MLVDSMGTCYRWRVIWFILIFPLFQKKMSGLDIWIYVLGHGMLDLLFSHWLSQFMHLIYLQNWGWGQKLLLELDATDQIKKFYHLFFHFHDARTLFSCSNTQEWMYLFLEDKDIYLRIDFVYSEQINISFLILVIRFELRIIENQDRYYIIFAIK